jgi:hypothetical protein
VFSAQKFANAKLQISEFPCITELLYTELSNEQLNMAVCIIKASQKSEN